MKFHELTHQRQADPHSGVRAVGACIFLPEHFENVRKKGGVNTDACIFHDQNRVRATSF